MKNIVLLWALGASLFAQTAPKFKIVEATIPQMRTAMEQGKLTSHDLFLKALQENLDKYEASFGEIEVPQRRIAAAFSFCAVQPYWSGPEAGQGNLCSDYNSLQQYPLRPLKCIKNMQMIMF